MSNKWLKLIVSVIACELVGILSTPFTIEAIPTWYKTLQKPFFSPPNWVFGPVWTTLYFLMGVALFLVWDKKTKKTKLKQTALWLFFIQLLLNFLWSFLFFGLRSPMLGFVDIVFLLLFIVLTIRYFYPLSRTAAYLLVPYIAWVSFATLLNFSIMVLNLY